jgi:MAD (mothers against decapentaplegic) family protein 1
MIASLSRQISLYLAGNWSERFDETLEALRAAVLRINSTRVDLSLTEGLTSWISSAFWVGVVLFAAVVCCELVFMLWLVCKLRTHQTNDKVVIAQALAAIEQGASPEIWLSMLKT